jgi:hypothetical protein
VRSCCPTHKPRSFNRRPVSHEQKWRNQTRHVLPPDQRKKLLTKCLQSSGSRTASGLVSRAGLMAVPAHYKVLHLSCSACCSIAVGAVRVAVLKLTRKRAYRPRCFPQPSAHDYAPGLPRNRVLVEAHHLGVCSRTRAALSLSPVGGPILCNLYAGHAIAADVGRAATW